MADKDKLVTLEDLKVAYDDTEGKVSDLKSALESITYNENLFDPSDYEVGRINGTGGKNTDRTDCFISDFIKVEPGEYYMKNSPVQDILHRIAIYTEAHQSSFISGQVFESNLIVIPQTGNYVRFCGYLTEKDTAKLVLMSAKDSALRAEVNLLSEETETALEGIDSDISLIRSNAENLDTLVNREDKKNYKLNNEYQLWDKFNAVINEYIKSDGTIVKSTSYLHCEIPVEAGKTYYFASPDPTTETGVKTGTAAYICFINTDDSYYTDQPEAYKNLGSVEVPNGVNRMIVSISKSRLYDNSEYSVIKFRSPTNMAGNKWSPRYVNQTQESVGSTYRISCIGDSLTDGAGGNGTSYPGVIASENSSLEVYKFAYPSEDSLYIAYGVGGMRIYADPFTIPASNAGNQAPTITIRQDNKNALVMDHVGDDNLCMIGGVLGKLKYEDSVNKFQRLTTGDNSVVLTRPEPIYMCFEMKHIGDITIIWSGRNDTQISSMTEATFYHINNIINLLPHKKYLVLGVMDNIRFSNIASIMTYYRRHYGSHFVNIRQYLLDYGIDDAEAAGMIRTPEQETQDATDIANGTIPSSLRSDEVHLNSWGYTVVGKYVYKIILGRGWLNG